ncbi:MAG: hypothetical protein ACLFUF_07050 [Opitutales bacterium]
MPELSQDEKNTRTGLRYARWAGYALGLTLVGLAAGEWFRGTDGFLQIFTAVYFLVYGILLCLPYHRMDGRLWKRAFLALSGASAGFVFLMIVRVMLEHIAAAEQGENLGVPGFEGLLIFVGLLQVPAVLFQHRPDWLE